MQVQYTTVCDRDNDRGSIHVGHRAIDFTSAAISDRLPDSERLPMELVSRYLAMNLLIALRPAMSPSAWIIHAMFGGLCP